MQLGGKNITDIFLEHLHLYAQRDLFTMDNRAEQIRAFEDFQRHARQDHRDQQYEQGRKRLREHVLAFATKADSAYRRTVDTVTGDKSIEPVFTLAAHRFLEDLKIGVSA